jgi:HSP20 family protein
MFNEYTPLLQLQNEMNRLFGSFAEEMPEVRPYGVRYPAFNAWEDGENCYIEAELPGLTLGETEVLVAGDQVTITGERKLEEPKEASWHRRERSQGRFSRTLTIPWQINAEKVEATLHDGVLTVRLPKAESAKPKKVKVLTA